MFDPDLLQAEVIAEFADAATYGLEADECMSILSVLQTEQANEVSRECMRRLRDRRRVPKGMRLCECCGIVLQQSATKPRRFCSKKCENKFYRNHT